jgi:DNA invertase Pin-like site-specific DNA recombinase
MRPAIGYIGVSTAKQGRSGLGLEAQQEALRRFAEAEGFSFDRAARPPHRPVFASAGA